jgi:protein-tyrosine phosphatase
VPTLHGSRYLLLEPPHHVAPPRFETSVFALMLAGYVPVITHPERLTWIEQHYPVFQRLTERGAWMQITAGALTGRFGKRPRYWGERMLDEGCAHLLATDAHDADQRAPRLAEGRDAAALRVGDTEALRLVMERPQAILRNLDPAHVTAPHAVAPPRSGPWQRVQEMFEWR